MMQKKLSLLVTNFSFLIKSKKYLLCLGLLISLMISGMSDIVYAKNPVYNNSDLKYVFDVGALPEIQIEIQEREWNRILKNYDENPINEIEVPASFSFRKKGVVDKLSVIGFRLAGNSGRARPEGKSGSVHNRKNPDWKHAHFALKFSKFVNGQTFRGLNSMSAKWLKDDPTYVREMYSYDLMRRFEVWTAPATSYAKLTIKIKEDEKPAYFGVYMISESIDKDFLKKRFPTDYDGFLWKGNKGADLQNSGLANKIGIEDPDRKITKSYDLKTNKKNLTVAAQKLQVFIRDLNSKTANQQWLSKSLDTDLFLRYLAISSALGNADDYWQNGNNYYLYFSSKGKVYFIPHDFDRTLGSANLAYDPGKQNPFQWGPASGRPLVNKLLSVADYRKLYSGYLRQLVDQKLNYFDAAKSTARIKGWQKLIGSSVKNDTGEDMFISDRTASWSNTPSYRLLSGDGKTNFFQARKTSILQATK